MNSRIIGDAFEYVFLCAFKGKHKSAQPLNAFTITKEAALKTKYDLRADATLWTEKQTKIGTFIESFWSHRDFAFYELTNENNAKKDVPDIRLIDELEGPLNISLKHNNGSIRHPRPRNVRRQVDGLYDEEGFASEHKRNEFYESRRELCTFKRVCPDAKKQLLVDVNLLVAKHLNQSTREAKESFVRFLTSSDTRVSHLVWSEKVKAMVMVIMQPVQDYDADEIVTTRDTFVHVANLRLRLHTASSKIKPTLALKYDVIVVK